MRQLRCCRCGSELAGNLDTFGLIGRELCLWCFLAEDGDQGDDEDEYAPAFYEMDTEDLEDRPWPRPPGSVAAF